MLSLDQVVFDPTDEKRKASIKREFFEENPEFSNSTDFAGVVEAMSKWLEKKYKPEDMSWEVTEDLSLIHI